MRSAYVGNKIPAQDGLALYYRDYGDATQTWPLTVLCLAGLTRHSADFDELALRLSGQRRVLAMDYRGRGESARDPDAANYQPTTYLSDAIHLLAATGCHKVVVIGTSLGGILAMAMAATRPTTLAGVVLNDVGPEIDPKGVARIASYVGQRVEIDNMQMAAEIMKRDYAAAYPDWSDADWTAEAARNYVVGGDGKPVRNYDPAISQGLKSASATGDLWPAYRALADIPTLCVRGAASDILSSDTLARMKSEKPDLFTAEVANRGHAPMLNEPAAVDAIEAFLAHCDERAAQL